MVAYASARGRHDLEDRGVSIGTRISTRWAPLTSHLMNQPQQLKTRTRACRVAWSDFCPCSYGAQARR